jgi:hypothetical protein
VAGEDWRDGQLVLQLKGVPGTKEIYWIYLPEGFAVSSVEGRGASAKIRKTVKRGNEQVAGIEVSFGVSEGSGHIAELIVKC